MSLVSDISDEEHNKYLIHLSIRLSKARDKRDWRNVRRIIEEIDAIT